MNNDIYLGTVIANSDTSDTRNTRSLGRVLVMIRGKSDISGSETFKNPFGENMCRKMSNQTLERVKRSEVWAYVLQPSTGGAQGSYSPGYNYTRPSNDSSYQNKSDLGAPSNAYQANSVTDGRIGNDNGSSGINTTANSYTPDNKDGAVKGVFSIPPIGATVAIQFLHGARSMPIVMGVIHGEESIASIYSTGGIGSPMPDYPGATQGIPGQYVDNTQANNDTVAQQTGPPIGTGGNRPVSRASDGVSENPSLKPGTATTASETRRTSRSRRPRA